MMARQTVSTHALPLVLLYRAGRGSHENPTRNKKRSRTNFKEQGNDYFKGKRYREALGFYTQGVDAKPDDSDARLKEALLNRAACNLELRACVLPSPPTRFPSSM